MKRKSLSSIVNAARCEYRTATGRQCCLLAKDGNSGLCARHAAMQPPEPHVDFADELTRNAYRFQNAQGINFSLGALYTLLAQDRISPRRAAVLAYIASLLMRSLTAIDNDRRPHAGVPPELIPSLAPREAKVSAPSPAPDAVPTPDFSPGEDPEFSDSASLAIVHKSN